jgi:exopolyphosphatase / guanosine-5'-triphosphate,3'-diphosphate pyrophosphatase
VRIAALDLGSNTFHLLVVDARPDGSFTPMLREKEVLRLGDKVGAERRLSEPIMDLAIETVTRFRARADSCGVEELVACATSAIREADNGGELIDRIYAETGVRVRVITGREEARLVFEAVRASVRIDPGPALCLDLGGGSLEVMVGDRSGMAWSSSLKLGAARLAGELVRDDPPSSDDIRRLRERLTLELAPVADEVAELHPQMAIGTGGTFGDLARMILSRRGATLPPSINQLSIERDELLTLQEELLSKTAAQRVRGTEVEPRRADLLPVGATVLLTAMELFGFDRLTVGVWGIREGMILDAIGHHDRLEWSSDPHDIRLASVLDLAARCNWDELHGRAVADLAGQLFDQLQPLHRLSGDDRELLTFAALLHDIGQHVATESHHKHTGYLIQHGRLRGFAPQEIDALAALARYHRRGEPKASHEPYGSLEADVQERVTTLAAILRVADGLDAAHSGTVEGVLVDVDDDAVTLTLRADGDTDLELWGGRRKRAMFERVFARRLELRVS